MLPDRVPMNSNKSFLSKVQKVNELNMKILGGIKILHFNLENVYPAIKPSIVNLKNAAFPPPPPPYVSHLFNNPSIKPSDKRHKRNLEAKAQDLTMLGALPSP